jgi:uncharacterized membrane protein YjgN (DUF898 family)
MEGAQDIAKPPAGGTAADFVGRRPVLIGIVLKNLLFNLLTVGIYRFWAKTRLRRYFWSGISIGGEPLEYTGKGSELFIGFLIVIAILVPFTLAYQAIDGLSVGLPTPVRIAVIAGYYIAFGFLVEIAIFRARRYRLSRTLWRAVRFNQEGSAVKFALVAFAQRLLSLVTLGLTEPVRQVVLQRRLFRGTRFGDQRFSFDGRARRLMAWYWPAWAMFWASVALTIFLNAETLMSLAKTFSAYEVSREPPKFDVSPVVWPLAGLAIAWVLYARYQVKSYRYFANSISLGPVTAVSRFQTRRVLGYASLFGVLNLAWIAVLLAIFGVAITEAGEAGTVAIPLLVALIVLLWLTSPIIRIAWLLFPIIREFCRTLEIQNLAAIDSIVRSQQGAPQYGEGLADALDVGGL